MSPSPRAPRAGGAAIFRFEGSGHAQALRCARGLPLKSNGDPRATRPRMRNATRCSRGYAPLTRREVMNDEFRGRLLRRLAAGGHVLEVLQLLLERGVRAAELAIAADQDLARRLPRNALLELRQECPVPLQQPLVSLGREGPGRLRELLPAGDEAGSDLAAGVHQLLRLAHLRLELGIGDLL